MVKLGWNIYWSSLQKHLFHLIKRTGYALQAMKKNGPFGLLYTEIKWRRLVLIRHCELCSQWLAFIFLPCIHTLIQGHTAWTANDLITSKYEYLHVLIVTFHQKYASAKITCCHIRYHLLFLSFSLMKRSLVNTEFARVSQLSGKIRRKVIT